MYARERARLGGHVGPRAYIVACIVVSRAPTRIIDTRLILIAANALFLSDDVEFPNARDFSQF